MTSDPSYREAAIKALARSVALFYRSLTEEGMSKEDALEVVLAWVVAATQKSEE